jgi:hypothetical protein
VQHVTERLREKVDGLMERFGGRQAEQFASLG